MLCRLPIFEASDVGPLVAGQSVAVGASPSLWRYCCRVDGVGDAVEVEVEVLLVIVDLDEVLSSESCCVLDVLPDHPLVVGLVDRLGFSGAQQTVVEQVGRRLTSEKLPMISSSE